MLGLSFLKYISDAFDERHADLEAEQEQGTDPEEKDEYAVVGVFLVGTAVGARSGALIAVTSLSMSVAPVALP